MSPLENWSTLLLNLASISCFRTASQYKSSLVAFLPLAARFGSAGLISMRRQSAISTCITASGGDSFREASDLKSSWSNDSMRPKHFSRESLGFAFGRSVDGARRPLSVDLVTGDALRGLLDAGWRLATAFAADFAAAFPAFPGAPRGVDGDRAGGGARVAEPLAASFGCGSGLGGEAGILPPASICVRSRPFSSMSSAIISCNWRISSALASSCWRNSATWALSSSVSEVFTGRGGGEAGDCTSSRPGAPFGLGSPTTTGGPPSEPAN
mmetsp:Transcript_117096/g.268815  ORF Transcript_117096/g.268815 Transcript_117096/m.268815 type:complete len:269 (-) Transcript_117096:55-861(-)